MQVIVELNTDKEILWALPGGMTPLTTSSTSAAIETDKLNDLQKAALANAINLGKVKSSTKAEEFFVARKAGTVLPVPKPVSPREELEKKLAEEHAAVMEKAKGILALSAGEIKK